MSHTDQEWDALQAENAKLKAQVAADQAKPSWTDRASAALTWITNNKTAILATALFIYAGFREYQPHNAQKIADLEQTQRAILQKESGRQADKVIPPSVEPKTKGESIATPK